MGYRLDGATFDAALPADLPSAPACPGALQLPPRGTPIVLLHDGPTVGGYPILGVVPTAALGGLAQRRPGMSVRFREIGLAEARGGLMPESGMPA
jgi:antagonist of KipI